MSISIESSHFAPISMSSQDTRLYESEPIVQTQTTIYAKDEYAFINHVFQFTKEELEVIVREERKNLLISVKYYSKSRINIKCNSGFIIKFIIKCSIIP